MGIHSREKDPGLQARDKAMGFKRQLGFHPFSLPPGGGQFRVRECYSCGGGLKQLGIRAMRSFLLLLLLISGASATPVVPAKDSKELREIMAAVADPVEDAVHQPVKFRINHIKMEKGWAFVDALPLTKQGKRISYAGTMFEEWVEEADEVLWVLLRYKRGRWYIVEKEFFTVEATWIDWPRYFRAPGGIFPKPKID